MDSSFHEYLWDIINIPMYPCEDSSASYLRMWMRKLPHAEAEVLSCLVVSKKDTLRRMFFSLCKQLFTQNYDLFQQLKTFLFGIHSYEAYGRRKRRRRRESGLSAPFQYRKFLKSLKFWMAINSSRIIEEGGYLLTLGREGLSFQDNLKAPFPCLIINIWEDIKIWWATSC